MTSLITTIRTSTINGNTGSILTIGNNLTTDAIQIGTLTNSISIGATGCTTTIGATGSSTIIGGLLQTSIINGATGSTLAIGNNLTTEQIRIGSDASTTNIILKGNTYATGVVNVSGSIINTNGTTTTAGLILTGNNKITLGGGVPTSTQLGYTKSTTSVNTSASTGYNNVTFNSSFNVFSNNDSGYYGLLLGPGTWLINYNLMVFSDSLSSCWIEYAGSELRYNPTIDSFGISAGAKDSYYFRSAVNFGYQLRGGNEGFSMNGFTVEQIPTNRYYNVQGFIKTATPSGFLIVDGNLTAVRIA